MSNFNKYNTKYISESKGISNDLKIFPDFIYSNFLENKKGFKTEIFINNLKVKNLSFVFTSENSKCVFTQFHIFGDVIENIIINIKITDKLNMKSDISHELTHLIRFYNQELDKIKIENEHNKKISSKWLSIKKSFINTINTNIIHLKLTLDRIKYDHEVNTELPFIIYDEVSENIKSIIDEVNLRRHSNKYNL